VRHPRRRHSPALRSGKYVSENDLHESEIQPAIMTYHYDVVRAAGGKIVEPAREIGLGAEVLWRGRGESEELLHVEELYAMVDCTKMSAMLARSMSEVSTNPIRFR
jgi:hypothetical protein